MTGILIIIAWLLFGILSAIYSKRYEDKRFGVSEEVTLLDILFSSMLVFAGFISFIVILICGGMWYSADIVIYRKSKI